MPTDYAIKDGRTVFDATTYTGNGSTQSITNAGGFKPDLVWAKARNGTGYPIVFDSVRGVSRQLATHLTIAEGSLNSYGVTSFNSNGFSVSDNSNGDWNVNGASGGIYSGTPPAYIGWQWQAGQGTNTTNTNGSITSTVSVNPTAGFSIVTHTGTGASGSVGHGLSSAPKFVITKARNSASWNWLVNIGPITGTEGDYLYLNATQAKLNSSNVKNPTSTTLPLVTSPENNGSGTTYVSYCWAEVAGFSKAFSYTGNGSTDGPFLYLGFRPKFIMIKRTDAAESWSIIDTSRDGYNLSVNKLYANGSGAEDGGTTYGVLDALSNGFKLRASHAIQNASGGTYIGIAFAENPFKYANAR